MESLLSTYLQECFADPAAREAIKVKLEEDGIQSYDDLGYLKEDEMLAYGFKKI